MAKDPATNHLKTGVAGEHLTIAALSNLGVNADIIGRERVDVLAWHGSRPIKIQVKSTSGPVLREGYKTEKYVFATTTGRNKSIKPKDVDIIALVAIDLRVVLFKVTADVGVKCLRLETSEFNRPDIERISWDACVRQLITKRTKPKTKRDGGRRARVNSDDLLLSEDEQAGGDIPDWSGQGKRQSDG